MCLQEDKHDRLLGKHGKDGLFSVCRSKEILENKKNIQDCGWIKMVLKVEAPSKIQAFLWLAIKKQ